jgi:hypothetical protein
VSDVLEGLRMLQVVRHQGVLRRGVRVARSSALVVVLIVVVAVLLAHEVLRALVLVGAAILRDLSARSSFSAVSSTGGMHTYWYRPMVSLMSPDENSYSFLLWPKMMTATSTEHSTDSSCAFLNRPPLRFRKVLRRVSEGSAMRTRGAWNGWAAYTERLRSSLMALISILRRPMVAEFAQAGARIREQHAIRARCTGMRCGWWEGSSRNKRSRS